MLLNRRNQNEFSTKRKIVNLVDITLVQLEVKQKLAEAKKSCYCCGQLIPDSELSFSSATAGATI